MKKVWIILSGAVMFLFGLLAGMRMGGKSDKVAYKELRDRLAKFEDYFAITNKWLKNRNQNKSVSAYFEKNHFQKIAIYGMGEMGKRLYEELQLDGVDVEFVMDRRAQRLDPHLKVCSIDDEIPSVDVIVITPTFDYEAIEQALREKTECKIVSIKDVVTN